MKPSTLSNLPANRWQLAGGRLGGAGVLLRGFVAIHAGAGSSEGQWPDSELLAGSLAGCGLRGAGVSSRDFVTIDRRAGLRCARPAGGGRLCARLRLATWGGSLGCATGQTCKAQRDERRFQTLFNMQHDYSLSSKCQRQTGGNGEFGWKRQVRRYPPAGIIDRNSGITQSFVAVVLIEQVLELQLEDA